MIKCLTCKHVPTQMLCIRRFHLILSKILNEEIIEIIYKKLILLWNNQDHKIVYLSIQFVLKILPLKEFSKNIPDLFDATC